MEAELVRELPEADGWQYEPKWDGFRGILENASGELRLWSRNARPLLRYFPELQSLGKLLPEHSALDGEIVIERNGVLDFDAMQTRLHPAESRINRLSGEIPARFVGFDILVWKGEEVWREPLTARRKALERKAQRFGLSPPPATAARHLHDRTASRRWAWTESSKQLESPYLPGSRDAEAASSRSRRCGRSSSSRCATTRCSRTASGTEPSSSASATTRIRRSARGASSGPHVPAA